MNRALGVALAVALAAVPGSGAAQDASASETAAARRLFEEGVAALEAEAWEVARERLSRSYELVPRASTLMNLATAQAELGLLVEAIESYRRFLSEMTPREARHRRQVEQAIAELEPRVAHVDLTIPRLEPGDVVRLDGRALPSAALEVALPMSPGAHRLLVERDGAQIGAVDLVLVEGERRGVEVALRAPAPQTALEATPAPVASGGDDTALFVGLGVGAAVALAAIVAVVLAVVLGAPPDPYVGNLGPGRVTF
ncbi:MAG: hypothetical protein KF729_15600 [Sandaracinaceae bacterium]|nr:hypothetical protein [Sandaracinaceae bacterium]